MKDFGVNGRKEYFPSLMKRNVYKQLNWERQNRFTLWSMTPARGILPGDIFWVWGHLLIFFFQDELILLNPATISCYINMLSRLNGIVDVFPFLREGWAGCPVSRNRVPCPVQRGERHSQASLLIIQVKSDK